MLQEFVLFICIRIFSFDRINDHLSVVSFKLVEAVLNFAFQNGARIFLFPDTLIPFLLNLPNQPVRDMLHLF